VASQHIVDLLPQFGILLGLRGIVGGRCRFQHRQHLLLNCFGNGPRLSNRRLSAERSAAASCLTINSRQAANAGWFLPASFVAMRDKDWANLLFEELNPRSI
jgi:hypothetical protein